MRTVQIHKLWKKSCESLQSAQILLDNDLEEDAISCGYYAVFYAAKAALLVNDIVVIKSHRALRNAFSKYLIMTREIEKEWGIILSREYDQRILADYNESYEASHENALVIIKDAINFVKRISEFLQKHNIDVDLK